MIERLRKRADFKAAATGRRFHTSRLTMQRGDVRDGQHETGKDEAGAQDARLGFTVTKKCGHSPVRNRIRRRLREAARLSEASLAPLRCDLVVVGRRDVLTAPFETLIDDMKRAAAVLSKPRKEPRQQRPQPATAPPDRRPVSPEQD